MMMSNSDVLERSPREMVLGLSGSPRKNGNSDILLKHIMRGVETSGIPFESYNLCKLDFHGCIGCEKCRKTKICTGLKDDMTKMYPKIIAAKGLVLVCPTHNYNVTSWMKAFIDRLYCFYNFENDHPRSWSSQLAHQGRKAVLAAICEQASIEDMGFTLDAMKKPLQALGYEVIEEIAVFKVFDKGKVEREEAVLRQAVQAGEKLALSLK